METELGKKHHALFAVDSSYTLLTYCAFWELSRKDQYHKSLLLRALERAEERKRNECFCLSNSLMCCIT